MVKTLLRSTLREIRQSLGRYLAIMAIVGLGVGFFAGLRTCQPAMMATGVEYLDAYRLYDFRALSTLGFTEEDVADMAAMEGVATARGAVYTDFLTERNDEEVVIKAHSLTDGINMPEMAAGRMPKTANECLADARYFTEADLGTVLTVAEDNDGDTKELLACGSYTIVGLCWSPYYLNYERGTGSIGSGSVTAFVYIPEEGFNFEAYYEIFLSVSEAGTAYSERYKDRIEALTPPVEDMTAFLADRRYTDLRDDALKELNDGEQELADGWEEYRTERADAEQELADAKKELEDGEKDYAGGVTDYRQGQRDYADGLKKYQDGLQEVADNERKLHDAEAELADAEAELADAKAELADAERELVDAQKELDDGEAEYAGGLREYEDGLRQVEDSEKELDAGRQALVSGKQQLDSAKSELEAQQSAYDQANTVYQGIVSAAGDNLETYLESNQEAQAVWAALTAQFGDPPGNGIAAAGAALEAGWDEYYANYAAYEQQLARFQEGESQLAAARQELAGAGEELDDARKELDDGWAEYNNGLQEYNAGLQEYNDGVKEVEDARQEIADGWAEIADAKAELDDAKAELDDARRELAKAPRELADARQELDDGWAEYNDGVAEAEQEFADAEAELADARKELDDGWADFADLKEATTYVLTRDENTGYASFDNDTAIVAAISVVFPVFFFLVAALVCMTTMTRMVDEQRTQIGVLKALGYSNGQIMGKYLFYSGSAATVGSVVGYAIGSTGLPWIIWEIYGMMYGFAPLERVFDPALALVSFAAALLCSMGATYLSCRVELGRQAADLIRPKAPKAGRRVFLERIGPLWRRLSFLYKVSVRNVFRYRSRLIMMVLGIGGCTALLATGFGIRDSIAHVADDQYDEITLYDYAVTFQDAQTQESAAAYLREYGWEEDQGLLVYSGSTDITTGAVTKSVYLVISATHSLDGFLSLHSGETIIPYPKEGEAVLNRGLADRLGIAEGDRVALRDGEKGDMEVTVSAICDNYVFNYIYIAPETYESQLGQALEYNTLYVLAHEGADHYEEGALLLEGEGVGNVTVNAATRDRVDNMLSRLDYIVVVVVLCAAALAFIVLYNLTNINITERIREIATIKVLGFYQSEVASYVFREIAILSVLGSLLGLFMGKALHAYVMAQIQIDAMFFACRIAPLSYALSLALTMLFTTVIALGMQPRLARIDMAESLKSIE